MLPHEHLKPLEPDALDFGPAGLAEGAVQPNNEVVVRLQGEEVGARDLLGHCGGRGAERSEDVEEGWRGEEENAEEKRGGRPATDGKPARRQEPAEKDE